MNEPLRLGALAGSDDDDRTMLIACGSENSLFTGDDEVDVGSWG